MALTMRRAAGLSSLVSSLRALGSYWTVYGPVALTARVPEPPHLPGPPPYGLPRGRPPPDEAGGTTSVGLTILRGTPEIPTASCECTHLALDRANPTPPSVSAAVHCSSDPLEPRGWPQLAAGLGPPRAQ